MSNVSMLLLGAGRFGREVAAWMAQAPGALPVAGFLDDEKKSPDIVGPIAGHTPLATMQYLACFGDGQARHRIRERLEAVNATFGSFRSPHTMSTSSLEESRNSLFMGACSIANHVALGNDLLIQGFACIGHDVLIADGVTVSSHAFIGGGASLGRFCTVHPHAVILPDVIIGEGAVIGAGAVVIRDVAPHTTVFGAPAKVIATRHAHE